MPHSKILIGDVRTRLAEIPDDSIQSCITSPPYWGLRDYGHDGQIGLEQTPDEYVTEMVAVFREVRRVLADDGVLWLNLGDSYNGSGGNHQPHHKNDTGFQGKIGAEKHKGKGRNIQTLKPKDLVGIPWRIAFALQADGWYLRQDIIWHKPNPMPESVTDRCTKSHEYLFMLTKSAKYYFDNEAIRERGAMSAGDSAGSPQRNTKETHGLGGGNTGMTKAKQKLAAELAEKGYSTRNKRSVWTIPTKPFRGAHFAVMPEALVEPCILASSRQDDTILDPFTGSGTVAVVALRHERNFIGTELNPEYVNIAKQRISDANPMFNNITIN
jgi:DNA modification methylase